MHSGINTGVVVTGERDISGATTGPTGDAVNIAARIQGLAGADEILIGPETVRLVRGSFDLEDRGTHELKGRSGPVQVARVLGVAAVPAASPRTSRRVRRPYSRARCLAHRSGPSEGREAIDRVRHRRCRGRQEPTG